MGDLNTGIPDSSGKMHVPNFDHDDGHWIVDMKRKKREMAQGIAVVGATAIYHLILLFLTCGATEAELTYGYERYPLFSNKYGHKGPGKYKHYMKVNKDDHYQIHGDEVDRPPDNYTYGEGVKYLPGGKVVVQKAAKAAASNKINPEEPSIDVPRPKDHDLADPHYVGGMKGNGYKHGRTRPKQALAFFEEVRVVVFVNEEVLQHKKEEMWLSNDIILKNKKEHKKEKEKMLKMKARDKKAALNSISENSVGGEEARPSIKESAPKLSIEERVRKANLDHSNHIREKPLSRREVKRSVLRDVSTREKAT